MASPAPLGPLVAEGVFTNPQAAKAALQEHAKNNGYAISVDSSNIKRVFYICTKGGKYSSKGKDPTVHLSRQRRNTGTIKTECPYKVVVRNEESVGWKLQVVDNNHNHGPVTALSALPQHRVAAMTPQEREMVKKMRSQGITPSQILNSLRCDNPDSHLIPRDIYNLLASLRVEELDGKTPTEWLLEVCVP
jgi:hypothetical protein